ncbi:hypothetical protein [Cohnella sp. GbtcB17]|uniref:hypothetical protein n=1 Tax=Cohnella sp. GbtcB17 TaxID=2824762 RepID=UPI001C30561D|nr:hypothetical protein [Cohnella sp. GbtcB17]
MSDCPKCVSKTVYDPPQTVYEDYYHPQHVEVVQTVEVVRRHHCVPVYHHVTVCTTKDVYSDDFEGGFRGAARSAGATRRR